MNSEVDTASPVRAPGKLKRSASFFGLGVVAGGLACAVAFAFLTRAERGGSGEEEEVVLRLAHGLDEQHPVHLALEFFAERVGELSGGELVVKTFPNGQLGSEPECVEQLQRGALAMVKTSAGPMESFIPEMAAFSMPYLFRDEEHYWNVLNGPVGEELLVSGTGVGIRGVCYLDAGARSFYTIGRPILTPEDAQGLKIRTLSSQMARDFILALGAGPTPIPWGELYTALQQRMVDGAENNPPSYLTSRHFEVAKEFSLSEHTRIPDILIFSESIWETLTPQQHEWINRAAKETVDFQRKLWTEKTEAAMQELEAAGVTIHRPDRKLFEEATASMRNVNRATPVGRLVERISDTP